MIREKLGQIRTLTTEIEQLLDADDRKFAEQLAAAKRQGSAPASSSGPSVIPAVSAPAKLMTPQEETEVITIHHEDLVPYLYKGPKGVDLCAYGHNAENKSKDARVQEYVDRLYANKPPYLHDLNLALLPLSPPLRANDTNPSVLSLEECLYILRFDLEFARAGARRIIMHERTTTGNRVGAHWDNLPAEAQEIVTRMVYQMGEGSIGLFKNFRNALRRHDFKTAAYEMVTGARRGTPSKWLKDTKERCEEEHARMEALA